MSMIFIKKMSAKLIRVLVFNEATSRAGRKINLVQSISNQSHVVLKNTDLFIVS